MAYPEGEGKTKEVRERFGYRPAPDDHISSADSFQALSEPITAIIDGIKSV